MIDIPGKTRTLLLAAAVALTISAPFAVAEASPFNVDADGTVTANAFVGDGSGLTGLSTSSPWLVCGTLSDLGNDCEMPGFPSAEHQYGAAFLTGVIPYVCSRWNVGRRFYNQNPFFVYSDNPDNGMLLGGAVFYTGTSAASDDACDVQNSWTQKYWSINETNSVELLGGIGCFDLPVYCKAY